MTHNLGEERKELARRYATRHLGAAPDGLVQPLTVLASPAWRGIEGDIWRASFGDNSLIIKHFHDDISFYVDTQNAISATILAGELSVGPKVVHGADDEALMVMEDLGAPWVAGGLHHAVDQDIRANIIAQKKAFQAGPKLAHSANIFDEIERLYARAQANNIRTHNDVMPFMDFAREAAGKITALGRDEKPCHRDGNTANLMVHENKSVKLIDFDLAANCDPFEDIGAYLVEMFESDADARAGFEQWHGSFDEGLFQRAMIYGLADDLRWGLIGSIMGATSKRNELEFSKYAAWRFLRLEARAKRSDAYDRIRYAA